MALTETPTATFEATASPTATLIETPTETATSEFVTLSPSPTPTETATQPAFPPEPPLTELFSDNFDSGALYLWTLGKGWALAASEGVAGGQALQVTDSDEAVTFVHNTLTDVAVQARFQFETGMVRLSVRQSDAEAYTAVLDSNGQVVLERGGERLGAAVASPNTPGGWRTVRLSAIGDIVRVAIDGLEVIAVRDTTPLPQGTISFAGIGATGLRADDVGISISSAEFALLNATTATPTITATGEPQLPLLFTDDFNNGSDQWSQQPGMEIVPSEGGYALSLILPMGVAPLAIPTSLSDVIVQARVQPLPGTSTRIVTRGSNGNGYVAAIYSDGLVELYRTDVLLQSATYDISSGSQWHTIRFYAIGNMVTVRVDDTDVITVVDPDPLPAGAVSFFNFSEAMERSLLDDVSIWGQIAEQIASTGLAAASAQSAPLGLQALSVSNPIDPNTKLLLWHPIGSGGKNIYELNDQQNLRTVKQDSGTQGANLHPKYSPDGSKIVYNAPQDGKIRIIKVSDGNSASPLSVFGYNPDWSPDGQYIVYQYRDSNFDAQLFVVKSDGSAAPQQLTISGYSGFGSPDWFYNPATQTNILAFYADSEATAGQRQRIVKANIVQNQGNWVTNGTPQVLTENPSTGSGLVTPDSWFDFSPVWSPDGSKIAFTRFNYFQLEPCNGCITAAMHRIFVVNADGTQLTRLTDGRSATASDPSRQGDGNYHDWADWSPNGNRIAYSVGFENLGQVLDPLKIKAMDSNGANKGVLTVNPGQIDLEGREPDWEWDFVRDIPPEAQEFHSHAQELGLPLPFDILPMAQSDIDYMRGYGPTTFALDFANDYYTQTHYIHTGLDYIGKAINRDVLALCDGVIFRGHKGFSSQGSTADNTGYGISLRCFADDPGDRDTDKGGRLSNIIITYNHLSAVRPEFLNDSGDIVDKGTVLGQTGDYFTCPEGSTTCTPSNKGSTCVGSTCEDHKTGDHLHLEMFIAKGFRDNNAIRINPMLMFTTSIADFHTPLLLRPYYPISSYEQASDGSLRASLRENPPYDDLDVNEGDIDTDFGIAENDLSKWSQHGDFYGQPSGSDSTSFWTRRITSPAGIQQFDLVGVPLGAEWPQYTLFSNSPTTITLVEFLMGPNFRQQNGYPPVGSTYIGPYCRVDTEPLVCDLEQDDTEEPPLVIVYN